VWTETSKKQRSQGAPKLINFKVLKNCTGYALPGQSLYIMGASGAGKTSMMNAIADRIAIKEGT
jgi:ABC-type multidrug transport system ATPase subunit